MDYSSVTFGIDVLISVVFGAGGAMGVWFKLKGNVNLLEQKVEALDDDKKMLNKRIDVLKIEVNKNREKADNSIASITGKMQEMELRIIQAIHEIGKK